MNAGWGLIRELSDHRVHTESSVVMTSPNIFVSSDVFRSFQYLEQSVLQAILCTGHKSPTTRIFSLHKSVIILGNELSIKICTAQRKDFYFIPCKLKNALFWNCCSLLLLCFCLIPIVTKIMLLPTCRYLHYVDHCFFQCLLITTVGGWVWTIPVLGASRCHQVSQVTLLLGQ